MATGPHICVGPCGNGNWLVPIVFTYIKRIRRKVVVAEVLFGSHPIAISLQRRRNTKNGIISDQRRIYLLNDKRIEIAPEQLACFLIRYFIPTAITIDIALPPPIYAVTVS